MAKQIKVKLPKEITEVMRWEYLCLVDPKSLGNNPRNWKIHPVTQLDGILAAVKKVGWHHPLLYNLTTGHLLDGHGRKEGAIKDGIPWVPVAEGHWTEEEENFILHSKDTLGSQYRIAHEQFKSLTEIVRNQTASSKGLSDKHRQTLDKLFSATTNLSNAIARGDREATLLPVSKLASRKRRQSPPEKPEPDVEEDTVGTDDSLVDAVVRENVYFDGDAVFELPTLLPELLCQPEQAPTVTFDRTPETVTDRSWYCHSARPFKERENSEVRGGTLGFFCEDHHIAGFYDNPADHLDALRDLDFSCLTAPDYSNFDEWPFPVKLWALYRSRWVARFWQSHGFRILPILQTVLDGEDNDVAALTLAYAAPPVVACQCRTIKHQGGSFESFGRWLTNQVRTVKPEVVVIYGGSEHKSKFEGYLPSSTKASGRGHKVRYIYLPSFIASRRQKGLIKRKKG